MSSDPYQHGSASQTRPSGQHPQQPLSLYLNIYSIIPFSILYLSHILIQIKSAEMPPQSQQISLLVTSILKLLISLTFLAFYVVRINKLDKLASNSLQKDRSLKFRIFLILSLILLQLVHIILSYADPYYYMYQFKNYTLINVLTIIDYTLQLYIITREYKKKTRRSRSVLVMWVLIAVQQVATIVVVEVSTPTTGIVLPIFKVIITVLLIVLTVMVEPPPQASLEQVQEVMKETKLLPLLSDTSSRFGKDNERIYVEFNKQFQVSLQKQHYQCSFKIAVYIYDKFQIITKSQSQFIQLSKQMNELFPNSDIPNLKNVSRTNNAINIMKYGEEKQKVYESFLIQMTKTDEFYAEPLMKFLEINEKERIALQKHKGALLKKETLNSEDQEKLKRPFFTVNWKDQKIHVSNSQILDFYVNKTKSQIVAFHNKLIVEKRLKIQLISEPSEQNEIVHFIYRAVNSKQLWRTFSEWMCLGPAIEDKIYNMFDFWNLGFVNLDMSVIGYETSFDKDNSIIYYYLLSVHKKSNAKDGIMLKKRFNDFVKLDKNIKKFIITEGIKNAFVPSLPPKFSPFESKTSPNSRRVYFDSYIKEIIKIQGINHCIKLLQFLQVDNQHNAIEFYKLNQQQASESEYKSSFFDRICIDELEIDRIG